MKGLQINLKNEYYEKNGKYLVFKKIQNDRIRNSMYNVTFDNMEQK